MKVALVHDYIKEFGGAERVLKTLSEMFPSAPIYTAFCVKGSTAGKEFQDKRIIESFLATVLKIWMLYSPLRFLTPLIWGSFDLSEYDLVITSCSWYITRGFKVGPNTKVIAYCHTPPRWLYGFETSVGLTKYLPVKIYSKIVGHFLRIYDFNTAQAINFWLANSKNVQNRIKKFYKKDSTVIYPPVEVNKIAKKTSDLKKKNYYLIVSRLVGAKGLEEAARIVKSLGIDLWIVGETAGFTDIENNLNDISGGKIKFLGRMPDEDLYKILGEAKGFIALAHDEDFGMTVVESQAAGTPVIAFNGGGFKESVIDGETGILVYSTDEESLKKAFMRFEEIKWDKEKLTKNVERFSKERFIREIKKYVEGVMNG